MLGGECLCLPTRMIKGGGQRIWEAGVLGGSDLEFFAKIGSFGMRMRTVKDKFAKKSNPVVWW